MADVVNGSTIVTDPTPVIIASISDVRSDIGCAKSDLRESIAQHAQHLQNRLGDAEGKTQAQITGAERFLAKEITDTRSHVLTDGSTTRFNLANVERDLQNRIHETRLEALKTAKDVENRITDFERNSDRNFRDVLIKQEKIAGDAKFEAEKNTRVITDRLDAYERRSLKDELDETRLENMKLGFGSQFALANQEVANLKSMVNSVDQNQRFSSKVSQFGAGNVALPNQVANQG